VILTTDVAYRDDSATAAGILHMDWRTDDVAQTIVKKIDPVAPYEPGQFYKRELPCIMSVLSEAGTDLEAIVVDGYVDLGRMRKPGLGRHLFDTIGKAIPVVGVAKRPFADTPDACRVFRGKSKMPLYVTAAGMPLGQAKSHVRTMHGGHRIPTILKLADRICRENH
jgi:deoxyribonuclease V